VPGVVGGIAGRALHEAGLHDGVSWAGRQRDMPGGGHGYGLSVSIHHDESFHQELRARQATPEGRAALRERTLVEHAISRQVSVQGRKARYKGTRKNPLATRICACVVNLHTLDPAQRQRDAA
jgi:hypothetical protein